MLRLTVWNRIHRVDDAIWDPRGKRALFEGLDLHRPEILFLGAADGYEAMQLLAMFPGGHAVLVDYDDYCRTHRFGGFPEDGGNVVHLGDARLSKLPMPLKAIGSSN